MTLPHDAPLNVTALQPRMIAAVRAHWKAFLVEGILLALLGMGAIIIPRSSLAGYSWSAASPVSC
jgi:uncharacterized membrane protein HdeD (DUF308 family)